MFRTHGLIPLTAAAASFVLAGLVYGTAPDKRLGRAFGFLALTLVFWNLNIFALSAFDDYTSALEYSRLFRTGSLFLLPAILHLTLVLPGRPIPLVWRAVLILDYAVSAFLAVVNVRGGLVTELESHYWGFYSVGSPLYDLFTISLVANFLASASLMIREYVITGDPRMRLQLKFWVFGIAVALPLGVTNVLPVYGVNVYPLGNLGSAIWAAIVGYAIVRHRLMDIEIVVAKGLSFIAASLAVAGPAIALCVFVQLLTFGSIHYDFSAAVGGLFLIVGILFPAVRAAIERRIGRSLFRTKFETHKALGKVATEVVRILDRKRLVTFLCEELEGAFGARSVSVYLPDDLGRTYQMQEWRGEKPRQLTMSADHPIVRRLIQAGEAILRDELPGDVACDAVSPTSWSVAIPFKSGMELVGFMCLGSRETLEAYTTGDLELLNRVAVEAGTALQNAFLYDQLRRSREMISRAGRLSAIGTLAAGIAHEIRNPLVSIQTFFQLAPERIDDEEFMTSFLKLAEDEVRRISDLISELLLFAKSPSPALREIDVAEVVERAGVLLEAQARSEGVRLSVRCEQQLPRVVADPDQVMQVILNIGLNAVQATGRGGEVTLEARLTVHEGVRYCQVEVRDTGAGIAEEARESIFDPFFTTKEKGTGLGLAIAQQIVSESGGFISVESRVGEGSQFLINLPGDEGVASRVAGRGVQP